MVREEICEKWLDSVERTNWSNISEHRQTAPKTLLHQCKIQIQTVVKTFKFRSSWTKKSFVCPLDLRFHYFQKITWGLRNTNCIQDIQKIVVYNMLIDISSCLRSGSVGEEIELRCRRQKSNQHLLIFVAKNFPVGQILLKYFLCYPKYSKMDS